MYILVAQSAAMCVYASAWLRLPLVKMLVQKKKKGYNFVEDILIVHVTNPCPWISILINKK